LRTPATSPALIADAELPRLPGLAQRYRLLTLDMIGFGFSDKPYRYDYWISDHADTYDEFLTQKGVSEFHLLMVEVSFIQRCPFEVDTRIDVVQSRASDDPPNGGARASSKGDATAANRRAAHAPARLRSSRRAKWSCEDNQYIFSSSWHAWLKARSGSGNPLLIDCLIPENVLFSWA
jgi:hypothetical protein